VGEEREEDVEGGGRGGPTMYIHMTKYKNNKKECSLSLLIQYSAWTPSKCNKTRKRKEFKQKSTQLIPICRWYMTSWPKLICHFHRSRKTNIKIHMEIWKSTRLELSHFRGASFQIKVQR
jgi:hypothetical protein